MQLIPKKQIGGLLNSQTLGASTVTTPDFKPITNRTYFLEAKRMGMIPSEIQYSVFSKTPELYVPKDSNTFKFDPTTKTFHKNFKITQTTPQDNRIFQQMGKQVPRGAVSPGQMKSILKNLNGGKIEKTYNFSVIPSLDNLLK